MSKEKNTGGPAFPSHTQEWASPLSGGAKYLADVYFTGMTIRDYFAAKASDADVLAALSPYEHEHNSLDRTHARYRHADNMLKAREQ